MLHFLSVHSGKLIEVSVQYIHIACSVFYLIFVFWPRSLQLFFLFWEFSVYIFICLVVTRIAAHSEKHGMYMLLDVNTEIYPMKKKEKFVMVLTPTLNWIETVGTGDDAEVILFLL